jgi:hypothetical protein
MSDAKPPAEPTLEEALVDIRTLARVALQSGDMAVMQRLGDDPDNCGNDATAAPGIETPSDWGLPIRGE